MGHNNISLLFRYENITDLGDQNRKKIEKGTSWLFIVLMVYMNYKKIVCVSLLLTKFIIVSNFYIFFQ